MDQFWLDITPQLRNILGSTFEIYSAAPLAGGDINRVFKLTTSVGNFCIKINDIKRYPGMFDKEAKGLELLRKNSSFTIPEVIHTDAFEEQGYLLLSFIESATYGKEYWESFGTMLADLHKNSDTEFGLDHDNYIGSLQQINEQRHSWVDFFYHNRVLHQIRSAMDKGLLSSNDTKNANILYHSLNHIMPHEKPSLIHGDLWSGNTMTDQKGKPCIIDPAVYYGHREMDLAMTKLFGGFDHRMYHSYHETYPLEKNWEERVEIHNLYPLLVHVNLFGGSYVQQVKGILRKFS
jgi:fructosamine-3-kinase